MYFRGYVASLRVPGTSLSGTTLRPLWTRPSVNLDTVQESQNLGQTHTFWFPQDSGDGSEQR